MSPKSFDIITINLNGERYIKETVDSVLKQTYSNYRLYIQDGGSTDRSHRIINELKKQNSQIHFDIKKDAGPADALNLALDYAQNDYVLFLNSDDILLPRTLEYLNQLISSNTKCDIIIGAGNIIDSNGKILRKYIPARFSAYKYSYGVSVPMHPATIFNLDFLKNYNIKFNVNNKTCWDGEFIVDCSLYNPKIIYTKELLAEFRVHKNSISSNLIDSSYSLDQEKIFYKIQGRSFRRFDHLIGKFLRLFFLGFPTIKRRFFSK